MGVGEYVVSILVLSATVFQVNAYLLNMTIFYQSVDKPCSRLFEDQLDWAYHQKPIRKLVFVDLVPFGMAKFEKCPNIPWDIQCPNGRDQCLFNAVQSCFFYYHPTNEEQVWMAICMMMQQGVYNAYKTLMRCSDRYGHKDYDRVYKCAKEDQGLKLQHQAGQRTIAFRPKIASVPIVVFNGVYSQQLAQMASKNMTETLILQLVTLCSGLGPGGNVKPYAKPCTKIMEMSKNLEHLPNGPNSMQQKQLPQAPPMQIKK